MNATHKNNGFTLLELLIAVAIIAILAAIALPSYQRYIAEGQRSDGKAALLDAAQILERCYTEHGQYNDATCDILNGVSIDSESEFFTVAPVVAANTFTLTATRAAGTDVDCHNMAINQIGAKTSSNSGGTDTTTTADCW